MSQPTRYTRQYDFVAWQTANPTLPPPAQQVENELNAVKTATDALDTNIALIQRDDGKLANQSVGTDQLSTVVVQLLGGINPRGSWVTATAYAAKDLVVVTNITYLCAVAHTAGTFATDLGAGKWVPLTAVNNGILSGAGAPSAGTGNNGDFYLDTTNVAIYGPKSGGAWGGATSLKGTPGANGSGVPVGGTAGQSLVKVDGTDYNVTWVTPPKLNVANAWTAAQSGPANTLTDAASIAWDTAAVQVATVTLAGNRTMAAPTNLVNGKTLILIVKQDATGSRTLAYNAVFKWPAGTAPVLSTTAGAVDILTFVTDGTNLYGVAQKAFA